MNPFNFASFIALLFFAKLLGTCSAEPATTLFIPGLPDQPLSESVIGVGTDSRTTYEIGAGTPTDTFTQTNSFGTATLVAGPTDVFITYVQASVTIGESCQISSSIARCAIEGSQTTLTITGTISPFALQDGAAAASTASHNSSTPSSASIAVSPGFHGLHTIVFALILIGVV
ncbi:hypothetical protein BD410DRAFT_785634 [Rickenella mellea]|uniref:GPI anchored cell wall protein n=1 Tax=Rickenella mellea TaxID=50990 RepID=A0A4Y7QBD6_9AGAM|nr:hypothetical protein BD410DRAFT_785634 [Rickenella mellea]